jgi:hypothetical protein
LRNIVNRANINPGKTPLHFAVDSWPQAVVKSLLNLGADVSITYKNLQPLLTQIPTETISEYLDEYCMTVEGYEEDTESEYESSDEEDNEGISEYEKDIGECSPKFMDMVRDSNIRFNYRFLLPSERISRMSTESVKRGESFEEEPLINTDPAALDGIYEKEKAKEEFVKEPTPEMKILEEISASKHHMSLLIHPVIKSFLYLKWTKISPLHEQNLKFRFIFLYCITWYIFNQFGGLEFNSTNYEDCTYGVGFDTIMKDNIKMKKFCADADKTKSSAGRKEFYKKYHLEGYAVDEDRSLTERFQFNFYGKFNSSKTMTPKGKKGITCNYNDNWYIVFAVIAAVLIILEVFDLSKKFVGMKCPIKLSDGQLLTSVLDIPGALMLIGVMLPVLIGSKELLWLTLLILIIRISLIEIIQFAACSLRGSILSRKSKNYLTSLDNYQDIATVVLTFLVVFTPNQNMHDPMNFIPSTHVKQLCGTSHLLIRNHSYSESGLGFGSDVSIKRNLSAFLIVISWTQALLSLSIHPMFRRFSFYLMMFKKVTKRFGTLLVFYGFFVVSFGLGFYIIFHNDVGDSILEADNTGTSSFDSPYPALFKIWAMFLGEIDFDGIPIGVSKGRKDGFASELLSYTFLALFMFMIVLVLNNLLNGLAVSDTEKIVQHAKVLQEDMYIESLSYSDRILFSYRSIAHFMFTRFPFLQRFLMLFDAKGYMLINLGRNSENSDGFNTEKCEAEMITTEQNADETIIMYFLRKLKELFLWDNSETGRKNRIVSEAKQILVDRKRVQFQQRLFEKNEEIKQMKFIEKIINTLNKSKN